MNNETMTEVMTIDASNPLTIIAGALQQGHIEPDQLSKLMDLQERWERNRAAEAFAASLAKFQKACPPIHKGRRADRFSFAGFDDIMATIRPILAECGLSVSFDVEQTQDGTLACTCIVKHGIHEHRTKLACPVPKELKVNQTQQYGAALSYAKRYALCAALNIVVTDEDVDARNVQAELITAEQKLEVKRLLDESGADVQKFLAWLEIEELSLMTTKQFGPAVAQLKRKIGGGK